MPEQDYPLEEKLEALLRLSAQGGFRNYALHDHEPAKAPVTNLRAGRRLRNPRSGGVLPPRDSNASWAVNIRPKTWGNKDKIWCGKIKSREEAQRIADIIFHYIGSGSVHLLFPGAGEHAPPFLNSKLQGLDTVEKRMRYIKRIAKGDEYHVHRKELMESVKEMVKHLTASHVMVRHESLFAEDLVQETELRCPPELPDETFDEYFGSRLSSVILLQQDEIDSMMDLLPDVA